MLTAPLVRLGPGRARLNTSLLPLEAWAAYTAVCTEARAPPSRSLVALLLLGMTPMGRIHTVCDAAACSRWLDVRRYSE